MKKVLIGLLGLLVLLALAATAAVIMMSPNYEVRRTQRVAGSPQQTYAVVSNLHTWPDWTVWSRAADPSCIWDWSGPESGSGAGMAWKGDVHGQGRLTLSTCTPDELVSYDMTFTEENGSETSSSSTMTFSPSGDQTEVVWTMTGEMSGVWKLLLPFMDSMIGPMFEEGLTGLDGQLQGTK